MHSIDHVEFAMLYFLIAARAVAQRLEQEIHNSRGNFCAHFHGLAHCFVPRCSANFRFAPRFAELRDFNIKNV
jgi:hypothetical protein